MKTIRNLGLALAVLLPTLASAVPNQGVMTYSGILKKTGGAVETVAQGLTFKLYDVATGGLPLWTESFTAVPTDPATGWFSVVLGASGVPLPDTQFLNQMYLGVTVVADGVEMTPRVTIGAATYALSVDYAGISGCTVANQVLQWNGTAWTCIATPSGTGGFTPPSCATNQVMKWNGTAWACAADLDTGITSVITAFPLSGTGLSVAPVTLTPCANGQILQSNGGVWSCIATPTGGTGGVTSISVTAPLISTGGATPALSIAHATATTSGFIDPLDFAAFSGKAPSPGAACLPGQVLDWNGTAFQCVTDQAGTGTVTGVAAAVGTPITITGTTVPTLKMFHAGDGTGNAGYIAAADYARFDAKAPTASPTFTGVVNASTISAASFVGPLSGNATSATTASSATNAQTAQVANSVIANVIKPSNLTTATLPNTGQVPSRTASDTFAWVTPLAGPAAACGAGQILTWNGSALVCVTDFANGTITSVVAGAGLTGGAASGAATLAVNFAGTGAATSAARSDHSHPIFVNVPLSDCLVTAPATPANITVGAWPKSKAISVPSGASSQDAVQVYTPMPISANPTIKVTINNPSAAAVTYSFFFFASGIGSGVAVPTSRWSYAPVSLTVAAGGTGLLTFAGNATVCPTTTMPAAGDLFWFSLGSSTAAAYNVLGIQLVY